MGTQRSARGVLSMGPKYLQVQSQIVGSLRPTGEGSGLWNLTPRGENLGLGDP